MNKFKHVIAFFAVWLVISASAVSAPSFSVSFWETDSLEFTIKQNFVYELMHDAKNDSFGISTEAQAKSNEFSSFLGVHSASDTTDFALQVSYAPCFWDCVNVGLTGKYHYYKYTDRFVEHNLLAGAFVQYDINNLWDLYFTFGFFRKLDIINAFPKNIVLRTNSYFFKTGLLFSPGTQWEFFFDISNVSLFEDNLLGVFVFDLGGRRKIWKRFSFGSDIYWKWEDASVPFDSFSQIATRVSWGVCF